MSLTQDDLLRIRTLMREEVSIAVESSVKPIIEPLANEIKALRSNIKERYDMISEFQSGTITDSEFSKRSLEEKLLTLNTELLFAAKQAGIVLRRS